MVCTVPSIIIGGTPAENAEAPPFSLAACKAAFFIFLYHTPQDIPLFFDIAASCSSRMLKTGPDPNGPDPVLNALMFYASFQHYRMSNTSKKIPLLFA